MKLEFSGQIFQRRSNIKFYQNTSSGSRVVPCRRTDGLVAFGNCLNAPGKVKLSHNKSWRLRGGMERCAANLNLIFGTTRTAELSAVRASRTLPY